MNYWLHRISHEGEVSYPLFDMGYLSLGWNGFSTSNILKLSKGGNVDGFNRFMSEQNETRRSRWCLWYFSQFEIDDIIVVPLYNGKFAICKVVDEPFSASNKHGISLKNNDGYDVVADDQGFYCPETNRRYDLGFLVKIEEMKRIPRSYTTADLVSRMKMRQTNGNINDLAKSVEAALLANAPISLHDTILDSATESIRNSVKKYLTPDKLECIIKWYMKKKGADRAYIPAKNESNKENGADADVIAEFDDLRIIFYIQVKKHEGKTDEWAVHQISEYQRQKQDEENDYTYISWAVSTAEFSEVAILKAKENDIRLVGGNDLIKMLLNCGINDIDESLW